VIELTTVGLLIWVFRVSAQFGNEHVRDEWVATATREACDAAQRAYIDVARAYNTTVDLGDCREMALDERGRLQPLPPGDDPKAADYYSLPPNTGTFPRRGPETPSQ
jgi:hypothetical protein